MDIDLLLKIAQTSFYVVGGTVAVLTYIKAKNGLLNTINTEYHKKVIERLAAVSEDLYREFDSSSPQFWALKSPATELAHRINEQIRDNKEKILSGDFDTGFVGVPIVESNVNLKNLADKYRTDPFLPKRVREAIVSFLDGRLQAETEAHFEATHYYLDRLKKGECWDTLDTNEHWLHNRINKHVYEKGFGIAQVEKKINDIRLQVQEYFEGFNPIRR